jgi:histidyl-tRNA synthetase
VYQAPRGTQDILPEDQPYWRFVEATAAAVSALYGYRRLDTPVFEDTALFSRSAGEYTDIVQKEMYTFDDRGGNSLTLKPEGTPAACRAYLQHGMQNLPQPVRLYYLAPIFRYDRPQAGRYRQHYQFGCEAFGDGDPAIDAEIIDLAWRFYRTLGLEDLTLQLNSIGCPDCRPAYLEALTSYYAGHVNELCTDCKTRLEKNPLRLLDCKQPSCQPVAEAAPPQAGSLCAACADHLAAVQHHLDLLGIPYAMNHRLVRGLDYYTRTVFEVLPQEEGGQSTIGGGGRYDNLIAELGGRPTPAAGFATGLERIIINLKEQGVAPPPDPGIRVLVAWLGDAAHGAAVRLGAALRDAGITVLVTTGGRSLKAQLRLANSLKAEYAAIIGDDEFRAGTVTLRHLADADQATVPAADLPGRLGEGA